MFDQQLSALVVSVVPEFIPLLRRSIFSLSAVVSSILLRRSWWPVCFLRRFTASISLGWSVGWPSVAVLVSVLVSVAVWIPISAVFLIPVAVRLILIPIAVAVLVSVLVPVAVRISISAVFLVTVSVWIPVLVPVAVGVPFGASILIPVAVLRSFGTSFSATGRFLFLFLASFFFGQLDFAGNICESDFGFAGKIGRSGCADFEIGGFFAPEVHLLHFPDLIEVNGIDLSSSAIVFIHIEHDAFEDICFDEDGSTFLCFYAFGVLWEGIECVEVGI